MLMGQCGSPDNARYELTAFMSPLGAWALSLGTSVGWIVDVASIGATIVYAFVSAAVFSNARKHGEIANMVTGIAGVMLMVLFGLMLQLPNLT